MLACLASVLVTFVVLARPFEKPLPPPPPRIMTNAAAASIAGQQPAATAGVHPTAPGNQSPRNASVRIGEGQMGARPESHPAQPVLLFLQNEAPRWMVSGWFGGVVLLGMRLCFGWCRVQSWRWRGTPLADPEIRKIFAQLVARLRVTRRVRLLLSEVAPGPMMLGWLRPVVLLPAQVLTGLSPEAIEAILAHELAHLRRHDYLLNLLQSLLEVVLFYHPAIWWLSRQVRETREECCDELAVSASVGRLQLASALAALAEMRTPPEPALAARRGSLLGRIARLLGVARPEPVASGRNAAWTLTFASALVVALGLVYSSKLMAQASDDAPAVTKAAPRGRVIDEHSTPVANARVLLYHAANYWGLGNEVVEEVRTDAAGQFAMAKTLRFTVPDGNADTDHYTLFALGEGQAPAWAQIVGGAPDAREYTLQLTKPVSQSYEVVDRAGKPVAGATVWLRYAGERSGPTPFREHFLVPQDLGIASAVTDADGKATLANLPDTTRSVAASMPGSEDNLSCTTPKEGVPRFTLVPSATLEGRVLDPLGAPVAGAKVWLYPKFRFHQYFLARTNEDGFYRVEKIWSNAQGQGPDWGKYEVGIEHPGFTAEAREVAFQSGQKIADFDIAAVPGTEIIGTVVDPETRQPVAGARLRIDSKSGRIGAFSNPRGEFRRRVIPGDVSILFIEPPSGHYVLNESGRSMQAHTIGAEFPVTFELPSALGRLGTVRGRVVDADGQPAAGCKVSVVIPGTRLERNRWAGNAWNGAPGHADGTFELESMPVGLRFVLMVTSADGKSAGIISSDLNGERLDLAAPVTLRPTTSAEVKIVNLEGQPRPNLAVETSVEIEGETLRSTAGRTDAQGVLRVASVIPGAKYRIEEKDVRYAWGTMELAPAAAGTSPAAPVRPAGTRTLTIADRYLVRLEGLDGRPMAIKSFRQFFVSIVSQGRNVRWTDSPLQILERRGADVVIQRNGMALAKPGNHIDFVIETEGQGIVQAEGSIPEQGGLILIRAKEAPGAGDTRPDPTVPAVQADEIAGRVLGPDGRPLAGATVAFNGAWWALDKPPLTTDASGVFRVPGAKEKWFTYVTVQSPGLAPLFLTDIPVGEGFQVTLQNATRVKGTIGGENPGKVALTFEKEKSTRRERMDFKVEHIQFSTETGPDGRYDFPIEPGKYQFTAKSADGRFARGEVAVAAGAAVALPATLQPGHTAELQLVDWETGQPVPGIEICIMMRRSDGVFTAREGSTRVSDARGIARWENLPPGDTEFESHRMDNSYPGHEQHSYVRWWREDEPVQWRHYDPKKKALTGSDGVGSLHIDVGAGPESWRILMEKGVRISGVILGPDGTPMKDINVGAVRNGGGGGGITGDSRFTPRTNEQGEFAGYIPAGNGLVYNLSAYIWAEHAAPAANAVSEPFSCKPGDDLKFQLRMTQGGWITGRVLDAQGRPAPKMRVSPVSTDHLDISYGDRIAITDANGAYRVGPVRAGEYEIQVGTGQGAPIQQIAGVEKKTAKVADGQETSAGDVTLPANATDAR